MKRFAARPHYWTSAAMNQIKGAFMQASLEVINRSAILLHIPEEQSNYVRVILGGADGPLVTIDAAGHSPCQSVGRPGRPGSPQGGYGNSARNSGDEQDRPSGQGGWVRGLTAVKKLVQEGAAKTGRDDSSRPLLLKNEKSQFAVRQALAAYGLSAR